MWRVVPLCALAVMTSANPFRDDPGRKLVEINITSAVLRSLPLDLQRDELEAVHENQVAFWATSEHLSKLKSLNIGFAPSVDWTRINYLEAKKAGYKHVKGVPPDWSQFCDYECMTARVSELADNCEFEAELLSAGKTNQGRDIWVLKIGNVGGDGNKVLMAGNIHGDETTGGQLLQRWAWETCTEPSVQQRAVATTVQGYYMFMFNPDGYERGTRGNANNRDLNRNFPPVSGSAQQPEAETTAYIKFAEEHKFTLSTMFHGGAIVVNYAYDNCYTSEFVPRPCPPASTEYHPKHADVVPSSKAYADQYLADGGRCTVGSNCLVNGAAWYQISGSLQDWAFHFNNQLDMTMEVSSIKWPSGGSLPGHYNDNVNSIYQFMQYVV